MQATTGSLATPPGVPLAPAVERALSRTSARVRVRRAVAYATPVGLGAIGAIGVGKALTTLGPLPSSALDRTFLLALAAMGIAGAFGALRSVSRLAAARRLDRAHALEGCISAAVDFGQTSDRWSNAVASAANAKQLDPSRAAPLRLGASTGVLALSIPLTALLLAVEVPAERGGHRVERPPLAEVAPIAIHADDLLAERTALTQVQESADPEVQARAAELGEVLRELEAHRLDREDALRRLAEVSERLAAPPPNDAETLREEMQAIARELSRNPVARDLARALETGNDAEAARAARDLRANASRMSEEERARLERSLAQAAEAARRSAERKDRELQAELQRMRSRDIAPDAPDRERLLEQQRRELEALEERQAQREAARRQLERLTRGLGNSPTPGTPSPEGNAPDERLSEQLSGIEEALGEMSAQEESREQTEELARQIERLRDLARAAPREGGDEHRGPNGGSRMDQFALRARGKTAEEARRLAAQSEEGSGRGGPRAPSESEGNEGGDGEERSPDRRESSPSSLSASSGSGADVRAAPSSGRNGELGTGAGEAHHPIGTEAAESSREATESISVGGQAGSRGPTRSTVIRTAAQSGFAHRDYQRVYGEYARHAEEVLEEERIPPGYRRYVERYFTLIRPRDSDPVGAPTQGVP